MDNLVFSESIFKVEFVLCTRISVVEQQMSRGPYSVWRQTYVGETEKSCTGPGADLACEVELIVGDLFDLEEVEVEDVLLNVSYARESRGVESVGVYTTSVIVSGYPLGVPKNELVSWTPSVSSLVHMMTFSESIFLKSHRDTFELFSMVKEMFDEDAGAVYVQHFFRSSHGSTIDSRVMWERQPGFPCFRRSKAWFSGRRTERKLFEPDAAPRSERKRKLDDDDELPVKKFKGVETVSFTGLVFDI